MTMRDDSKNRSGATPRALELDKLALLWQIFAADERDGIPKSVFQ
jgi:hypothetical protein